MGNWDDGGLTHFLAGAVSDAAAAVGLSLVCDLLVHTICWMDVQGSVHRESDEVSHSHCTKSSHEKEKCILGDPFRLKNGRRSDKARAHSFKLRFFSCLCLAHQRLWML